MRNMSNKFWVLVVNFRVIIIAIFVSLFGFALIYFNTPGPSQTISFTKWQTILCSLGGTLFSVGFISILWDLAAKRAFAEEILTRANLSNDVIKAGLIQIADNFRSPEVNWHEMLKHTKTLDVFVCWAYTWRNQHQELLKEIINTPNGKIRVILPDPEHESTIQNLSNSFSGYNEQKVRDRINEAIDFFIDMDRPEGVPLNHLEIWLIDRDPKYSWYRMDNCSVFAFYAHRGKEKVPTLVSKKDGYLYNFSCKEFEFFFSEQSNARIIYPRKDHE